MRGQESVKAEPTWKRARETTCQTNFARSTRQLRAVLRLLRILTNDPWTYPGKKNDLYQTEHDELFASFRNGKPINNGEYMAKSTLLAIMGRMATYTGQLITWEQALNSQENLSPQRYAWDAEPPKSGWS